MIITLCGSARFEDWFHAWNEALSLSGHCVFGLASYPSQHEGNKDWYSPAQKEVLDDVHKKKIDASDAIFVLNVFGYIGHSTLYEIIFARDIAKKKTFFLESWGKGHGIGELHRKEVQEAKARYIPADYLSSMDTFESPSRPDLWRLLPSDQSHRQPILKLLKERIVPLANGWGFG